MSKDKPNRGMIWLPGFKGVGDGPPGHFVLETTLRELTKAIAELVDASESSGVPVPTRQLEAEIKAAEKLFRQRATWICESTSDNLHKLNAALLIEALVLQAKWCRRLSRLTQTTFVQPGKKQ